MEIKMTRKGDFVLRQLADEYVLIPYGATTEKMNQVLTLTYYIVNYILLFIDICNKVLFIFHFVVY